MRSVTAEQMRELDRRSIEEYGIPGEVLMERAGCGLADSVMQRAGWLGSCFRGVTAVAGRGNNGGDAFAAARILKEQGINVELLAVCSETDLRGDAAVHFLRMKQAGVPFRVLVDGGDWNAENISYKGRIIIDGLLGTGVNGPARGVFKSAIEWINRMKRGNRIAAIDVPSGLDADTGLCEGAVVEADWTVTMGLPKCGLLVQGAIPYVGNLDTVDIGIPGELTDGIGEMPSLITAGEMRNLVPARGGLSHKGSHGALVIIAGSAKFPGAAVLAAMGGVRSGAGLVYVITAESAVSAVVSAVPEAITRGVGCDETGGLDYNAVIDAVGGIAGYKCIVAGPGLTAGHSTLRIIEWLGANADCGLLLDADALNVMADHQVKCIQERCDVVVTPHPGEAGRLLGCTAKEVQGDRLAAFEKLKHKFGGVVVLKGAGTLAGCGEEQGINLTGNSGMAKGGSGDVLSGLTGGLIAQGMPVNDAARLGVFIHGRAGDIAAYRGSVQGMTAGDLAGCISCAFTSVNA